MLKRFIEETLAVCNQFLLALNPKNWIDRDAGHIFVSGDLEGDSDE